SSEIAGQRWSQDRRSRRDLAISARQAYDLIGRRVAIGYGFVVAGCNDLQRLRSQSPPGDRGYREQTGRRAADNNLALEAYDAAGIGAKGERLGRGLAWLSRLFG